MGVTCRGLGGKGMRTEYIRDEKRWKGRGRDWSIGIEQAKVGKGRKGSLCEGERER